jgi:hypothetical protein
MNKKILGILKPHDDVELSIELMRKINARKE